MSGSSVKYDDASWHYEGEFPKDSPIEYGAVHIGVFLKLAFENGFAGELHLDEWPEDVQKVLDGEWTGTTFVMNAIDGKLTDEDFNKAGNRFAKAYYSDGQGTPGQYVDDFIEHSGIDLYLAGEDKVDLEAMRDLFTLRLENFLITGDPTKETN